MIEALCWRGRPVWLARAHSRDLRKHVITASEAGAGCRAAALKTCWLLDGALAWRQRNRRTALTVHGCRFNVSQGRGVRTSRECGIRSLFRLPIQASVEHWPRQFGSPQMLLAAPKTGPKLSRSA